MPQVKGYAFRRYQDAYISIVAANIYVFSLVLAADSVNLSVDRSILLERAIQHRLGALLPGKWNYGHFAS
ncbi:hypothetical protein ABTK10_20255, partial [Acinetobacter baumannii]